MLKLRNNNETSTFTKARVTEKYVVLKLHSNKNLLFNEGFPR